ncbi:MAG: hypothetical protein ABIJ81_02740, partial [Patescibacteria group bacterium]
MDVKKQSGKRKSAHIRFSAYQKNLDLMKLLVSYKPFEKDVLEARERLGVPPSGFGTKNSKAVQQWTNDLVIKSDKVINSSGFNEQLKMIHQKLEKGEIGYRMADKQSSFMHLKVPINYFSHISLFLTKKYNVPENFSDYIRWYILYGIVNAPVNNFVCGSWPASTLPKDVRYLPIKIYSHLTLEELKDLKKEIELMGRHLPRFQA